jgi:hypothetical protein
MRWVTASAHWGIQGRMVNHARLVFRALSRTTLVQPHAPTAQPTRTRQLRRQMSTYLRARAMQGMRVLLEGRALRAQQTRTRASLVQVYVHRVRNIRQHRPQACPLLIANAM